MNLEMSDVMYNDLEGMAHDTAITACCYPSIKQESCTGTWTF